MAKSEGVRREGCRHPMSATMQAPLLWKKRLATKGWASGLAGMAIESTSSDRRGGAIANRRNIRGPQVRAFTERQQTLVQEAWKVLKPNAPHHGLSLFLKVFEISPATKKYFTFLNNSNVPLEKNPKLKAHALMVFITTCEAATSLLSKDKILTPGTSIKELGHTHLIYGILEEHFDVVGYCLLQVLAEGLPKDMWSIEMREAWSEAYSALANAIENEMRQEKDDKSLIVVENI